MAKFKDGKGGKIVRIAGSTLLSLGIAAGAVFGGIKLADKQKKIDKYLNDDVTIAKVLTEDLNSQASGSEVEIKFENPQFRGMIADAKDKSADVEVFLVAQQAEKPYMIKASIDNPDGKVSGERDALLGHYNPHIMKYNIIENIENLDITYDIAPTSMEILKMMDEMGQYTSPLNTPEFDSRKVQNSVVVGYTLNQNEDSSVTVSMTTNVHSVYYDTGLLGDEDHYYHDKQVSFKLDSMTDIEQQIYDYLCKINLHKDDLEVSYSVAGVSDIHQSTKPYVLNVQQQEDEKGKSGPQM